MRDRGEQAGVRVLDRREVGGERVRLAVVIVASRLLLHRQHRDHRLRAEPPGEPHDDARAHARPARGDACAGIAQLSFPERDVRLFRGGEAAVDLGELFVGFELCDGGVDRAAVDLLLPIGPEARDVGSGGHGEVSSAMNDSSWPRRRAQGAGGLSYGSWPSAARVVWRRGTGGAMPFSAREVERCRMDFPALARAFDGVQLAYLDGPAGSQVPERVIAAVAGYYRTCNANTHGAFVTSRETDEMIAAARAVVAAFLGASSWREISFGANMTTLNFALRARHRPGDEGRGRGRDHRAGPRGQPRAVARPARARRGRARGGASAGRPPRRGRHARARSRRRTRVVAIGYSSNALGTVNDVPLARELARAVRRSAGRGRGALRAALPSRRGGARPGLPAVLGVQVLRAARRDPLRAAGRPRGPADRQAANAGRLGAVPDRDRDPEPRGDRRGQGGDRVHRLVGRGRHAARAARLRDDRDRQRTSTSWRRSTGTT